MIREALLVGINDYPGTGNDLLACVNDATQWGYYLRAHGYTVHSLTDSTATKANILAQWGGMIGRTSANDGSSLVFMYSGHGTRIARTPAIDAYIQRILPGTPVDADGYVEAIVPWDAVVAWDGTKLLLDCELRLLMFGKIHGGTYAIGVLDSCFAGGLAPTPLGSAKKRARGVDGARFGSPVPPIVTGHSRMASAAMHNVALFLASAEAEVSWEGPIVGANASAMQYGFFNYAMLQASRAFDPGSTFGEWGGMAAHLTTLREFDQHPVFAAESAMAARKVTTLI